MKKFVLISMVGAAVALSACANQNGDANYGYESDAPYASERTVGTEQGDSHKGDAVFQSHQKK